ncbi:geranylgeranylglyceryl/heptaprenylglyceryl phosphate synthase [Candidatus Micrarchaeota archaeon]|nr:geranylgeranylglyceryl/heptaprenylglyceryl phosphate synthase [Candidatus Micrarchaeota archaeon]
MEIGKTEKYLRGKLAQDGAMLFSLVDPDKCSLEKGASIAKQSYEAGADVILVGGSIGAQGEILDKTVKMIKESVSVPVILFPGNIGGLSAYADATYFMQMLNSRDVYWLSTAQIQAAPVVARMKIEAIPTTYIVVEPGRAVGWIGNANLIPRDRADLAAACALSAKYSGSHILVSDCGSGSPEHAPVEMVNAVKKVCGKDLIYILGGGIRTPQAATDVVKAGADAIQVGTAFELENALPKMKQMVEAVKKEGKKRV